MSTSQPNSKKLGVFGTFGEQGRGEEEELLFDYSAGSQGRKQRPETESVVSTTGTGRESAVNIHKSSTSIRKAEAND